MKTIWLLDFDGVINANKPGWSSPPKKGYAYAKNQEWRIRWSPKLVGRIWDIYRIPDIEIKWASTWCGITDQLERLLRLPHLGTISQTEAGFGTKNKAAQTVLMTGNRLVWTDDEVIPKEWDSDDRKLIIRPRPNRGLQPEDLDRIEQFALRS